MINFSLIYKMPIQFTGDERIIHDRSDDQYIGKFNGLMIALQNYDNFYHDYDMIKIIRLLDDDSRKIFNNMSYDEINDMFNGLLYVKINNPSQLKQFLSDKLN